MLVKLKEILEEVKLPKDLHKVVDSRLDSSIDEVQQKEPNKQIVKGNLKRVAEILEGTEKTIDSGKSIIQKIKPIFEELMKWLNIAKGFFGFC